ncbi:MAG: DUF1080 domain-containing protein [Pedosphaera sp.]|nr:DUF1080 domain-containing protein [Pedosphaera sp.]
MRFPLLSLTAILISTALQAESPRPLFDGKTFAGWEGDTRRIWRIENGMLAAGNLNEKVPYNDFLATTQQFTNFIIKLKFRLTGTEGFVNSGVQLRSQRIPNDHEMIGYQADIGEGWYGCLYDESRRNKVMARPDEAVVKNTVKPGDWNDYEIRCVGRRIVLKINDVQMVDYTEADEKIPQFGYIGLQVHGGGKTEVRFKDITIEKLSE